MDERSNKCRGQGRRAKAIAVKLHSEIARVVKMPELREQFIKQAVELSASASPEECTAFIKHEYDLYKELFSRLGLARGKGPLARYRSAHKIALQS